MNHWFLCARDVMWATIGSAPIFMGMIATGLAKDGSEVRDFFAFWIVFAALALQWSMLLLLAIGVVK